MNPFEPALRDHERALPVISAIEHHEDAAGVDPAQGLFRIGRAARQPHPQHIHRRPEIEGLEPGFRAHGRVASVGSDDQIGADRQPALGRLRLDPGHASTLFDPRADVGLHPELERRMALRLPGDKI